MAQIPAVVLSLLYSVRRRLRVAWLVAALQWLAPGIAVATLVVVLVGRVRPWVWPERVALGFPLAALVVMAIAATIIRIPLHAAALVADRGFDTRDTFSTALDVDNGAFTDRIHARACALAANRRGRDALALRLLVRRLAFAALVAAAAIGLALVDNPQDRVRVQQSSDAAAVQAAADNLRAEAAALAERATNAAERAVADELTSAANELDRTTELTKAEEILRRTEANFAQQVPHDVLAAKAATKGLARSLAGEPLAGGTASGTAQQFTDAAASLQEATPAQQQDLAERLSELAESQRVGDPATAQALAGAAAALKAGDTRTASSQLRAAAAAANATAAKVAAAQAARTGGAAAANAAGKLPGSGKGAGAGTGAGTGAGAGTGTGLGSGNPSGNVSGGGSGGGQPGQGGAGTSGGTSGQGPSSGEIPQLGDVNLPVGSDGEQINAGGTPTGEPGEIVGKGDGPTQGGSVRTPVSNVLPTYTAQALDALNRGAVAPTDRTLVTNYFDELAGQT